MIQVILVTIIKSWMICLWDTTGCDIVSSGNVNIVIVEYFEVVRDIMKYDRIMGQWDMKSSDNGLFDIASDVMKPLMMGCIDSGI